MENFSRVCALNLAQLLVFEENPTRLRTKLPDLRVLLESVKKRQRILWKSFLGLRTVTRFKKDAMRLRPNLLKYTEMCSDYNNSWH